jgi:hypothetical protein
MGVAGRRSTLLGAGLFYSISATRPARRRRRMAVHWRLGWIFLAILTALLWWFA